MAKAVLPDSRVLGSAPNIGVNGLTPKLNVSNWSSGDAMLASGLDSLGRGIAGLGAGFEAQQSKADSVAEATASADFSIAKDNSYTKLSTDPDYEKAPTTYREESTKALNENAAKITDPVKRELFIQRGRVGIETSANNLQQRGVILKNQQTVLDNDGRLDALANQALADPDEARRAEKLGEAQKILRSELENRLVSPKEYRARNRAFIEKYGETFGTDLINRDPAKALEQLDKIVPREAPVGPQSSNPSVDTIFSAIHQQESGGGRNTSTSVTGARGDMQIQPGTWAQYARPGEDINNPADNKAVGKRIIADLYEKAGGDPARVAVGYFSGPGNIAPQGSPTPWKADRADPTGKTVSSYVADVTGRLKQSPGKSAQGESVTEVQSGAVRSQPISPKLKTQLEYAAEAAGVKLEVVSGGQSETGPFRVGSTRHDGGGAADVVVRDAQTGRLLDHSDAKDQAIFAKLIQSAAQAGVTGIGAGPGYMNNNSIHLGGGVDAVWGAKGKGENAPQWVRDAYSSGRKAEPVVLDESQPGKVRLASLGSGTVSDASPERPQTEGVQVAQAQTGTPLDFLRPDQIVRLRQKAEQALKAKAMDDERAVRMEERERKRISDQAEDTARKSIFEGNPITAKEIVNNPQLVREAQDRLIGLIGKVDKPEPPATVSAKTAKGLLERMRLPEGDPNRLTNVSEIYDAYTKDDGGLTKADFEFVRKEFGEQRSESGDKLTKRKTDFINSIKGQITKSNPLMGKIDTSGDQQLYHFDYDVGQKVDQYRKEGKNPHDLFDPSKPDYLGKPENIVPYQKTLQQSLQDRARALSGKPATTTTPAPNAAPVLPKIEPRKPGETPAEYLKRTGKL